MTPVLVRTSFSPFANMILRPLLFFLSEVTVLPVFSEFCKCCVKSFSGVGRLRNMFGVASVIAGVVTGATFFVAGVVTGAAFFMAGVVTGAAFSVAGLVTGAAFFVAGVVTGAAFFVAGVVAGAALLVALASCSFRLRGDRVRFLADALFALDTGADLAGDFALRKPLEAW